ncbi:MAG: GNAT family N-acetyltransferase [Candidatus Odinarchaeota archaeon]
MICKLISPEELRTFLPFLFRGVNEQERAIHLRLQQIEPVLSQNAIEIFAAFSRDNQVLGFTVSQQINDDPPLATFRLFHVLDTLQSVDPAGYIVTGKELFNAAFSHLKKINTFIRVELLGLPAELVKYIVSNDFQQIDRVLMNIGRSSIDSLVESELPPGYSIVSFKNAMKTSIGSLMLDYSSESTDNIIYPEFAGADGSEKFLERFDETRNRYIKVLIRDQEILGVCFLLRSSSSSGHISDLGISPNYQRKGLGRALLTQSLLHMVRNEPSITRVALRVTIENKAAINLYRSLGFDQVERFPALIWKAG